MAIEAGTVRRLMTSITVSKSLTYSSSLLELIPPAVLLATGLTVLGKIIPVHIRRRELVGFELVIEPWDIVYEEAKIGGVYLDPGENIASELHALLVTTFGLLRYRPTWTALTGSG